MELEWSEDWILLSKEPKDLNGKWLMAGRMTEQGERRRDTSGPRKTMKFLLDGFFQWIAYNTETFQFFGSWGGYYTTEGGKYTEHIEGTDWHHQGFSSKGDPMHEIWSKRQ